jgi:hypothetical protein
MAFTYYIEANGNIAHVIGTKRGSLDSARDTFADLIAEPHLHRPFGLLIDVRAVCNIPSREEAYSLSKFALVGHADSKHYTALVVQGGLQYGIARLIQLFSELRGAQIDVFIDEPSAQCWLWEQFAFAARSESSTANR